MKQKDLFYIVFSSFIVVVIWIIANLLHIQNTSKLSEAVVKQTSPINPTFDTQTLTKLKERSQAAPDFTIKKVATPSATPSTTQNITPTQSPIPTTTVTPSLNISPTLSP